MTKKGIMYVACGFISVILFSGILTSCDNIYNNSPEYFEKNYDDEISNLNNLFQENNMDIKIEDIKPASEKVIDNLRRYKSDELSSLKSPRTFFIENINWDNTELLSIESHNMAVAITEVGETSDNGHKYLYSLMNDEGIFNQYINIIPYTEDTSLNDDFSLEFTFTNLDGSCIFEGEKTYRKTTAFDSSYANSEEEGCWSTCVEETISEGSATFLLACMATGPYCAAAIAIACGGHCLLESSEEEV